MPNASSANSSLKGDRTNSKRPIVARSSTKGERPRQLSPYTNGTRSVHANPCNDKLESIDTKSRANRVNANLVTP